MVTKKIKAMFLFGMFTCIQLSLAVRPALEGGVNPEDQCHGQFYEWTLLRFEERKWQFLSEKDMPSAPPPDTTPKCPIEEDYVFAAPPSNKLFSYIDDVLVKADDDVEEIQQTGDVRSTRENDEPKDRLSVPSCKTRIPKENNKLEFFGFNCNNKGLLDVIDNNLLWFAYLYKKVRLLSKLNRFAPKCGRFNMAYAATACTFDLAQSCMEWKREKRLSKAIMSSKDLEAMVRSNKEEPEYSFVEFADKEGTWTDCERKVERMHHVVNPYLISCGTIGNMWLFYAAVPNIATGYFIFRGVEQLALKVVDNKSFDLKDLNRICFSSLPETVNMACLLCPRLFFR